MKTASFGFLVAAGFAITANGEMSKVARRQRVRALKGGSKSGKSEGEGDIEVPIAMEVASVSTLQFESVAADNLEFGEFGDDLSLSLSMGNDANFVLDVDSNEPGDSEGGGKSDKSEGGEGGSSKGSGMGGMGGASKGPGMGGGMIGGGEGGGKSGKSEGGEGGGKSGKSIAHPAIVQVEPVSASEPDKAWTCSWEDGRNAKPPEDFLASGLGGWASGWDSSKVVVAMGGIDSPVPPPAPLPTSSPVIETTTTSTMTSTTAKPCPCPFAFLCPDICY